MKDKWIKGHTGTQHSYLQLYSVCDLHSDGSAVFLQGKHTYSTLQSYQRWMNNRYDEEVCPQDMQWQHTVLYQYANKDIFTQIINTK